MVGVWSYLIFSANNTVRHTNIFLRHVRYNVPTVNGETDNIANCKSEVMSFSQKI